METAYKDLFKLYDLIQNGSASSVEKFLSENKLDLNIILPCKGISVLHLAVGIEPEEKSKICTEIILQNGGEPNLSNDDKITPVHIAAIWGRVDNLKLLMGFGGDPSIRDNDGHSAFDYAVREQQWDVYNYLHNVVDELDDSLGSICAYTLDLEKVLITTDQVVAEYEPINEEKLTSKTLLRKSEMVRDWCEKTTLVMNKLYPTIIGETYYINDSLNWKNIDVTTNISLDMTKSKILDDTKLSYKTCLSKNACSDEIEISGIKPLQITSDESNSQSCSCDSNQELKNQRVSLYQNFSLPGSPNSITHINYNTKSSLKKCKNNSNSLKRLDQTEQSLSDNLARVDLDKAMVLVQNKTNEWLFTSNCTNDTAYDHKGLNTRRSSASSGVSSNYSSGSIILANVEEVYRYEDKEENVVLLEKRIRVATVVLSLDEAADSSPDQTILSVASSLPPSMEYDNQTLRAELIKLGFAPGPIQDSTRMLYLKKLQSLRKNPLQISVDGKTYSIELEKSLRTHEWMENLTNFIDLENKARADFNNSNTKWREGAAKTSFTYLLLNPRQTDNLPGKAGRQSQHASWVTFVNSIFYVGKGKRSRAYSHLYQALTLWRSNLKTTPDKKVQHILDIWASNLGVVCLHVFQNVIPAEAYTNEAAMIDVMGLNNLKNLKVGNYYGVASSWPMKDRRLFGQYLLYKAMLIFLNEGERQLRPDDID